MNCISEIKNWIHGHEVVAGSNVWLEKFNPHTGKLMSIFNESSEADVNLAIDAAADSLELWSNLTPVKRGQVLNGIVQEMKKNTEELAACICEETGKPSKDGLAEVGAAILQGEYWAGEGMRLHGRSLTSAVPGKTCYTVRQPRGVAGLIVPANTPIANIAWKSFPALISGNTVVLKSAEDAPKIANLFAKITKSAGLTDGVFNVIHGSGSVSGTALVQSAKVAVVSFTGSTNTGRKIAEVLAKRLARFSLELGGKNPFIVCDDADLNLAVHWAALSAFSNAGQRCAAGSRIIVFRGVYNEFKEKLVAKAKSLRLGVGIDSDLGPVVNKRQQLNILAAIEKARLSGARILCGGGPPLDMSLESGYYVEPTIIEEVKPNDDIYRREIFGPVATIHTVENLGEALEMANDTEYGLTAAVHTTSVDRAMWFARRVKTGVANVNLGTFGSEPHMPFGGFSSSGNGTREPGIEALDVYTELKNISILTRNELI